MICVAHGKLKSLTITRDYFLTGFETGMTMFSLTYRRSIKHDPLILLHWSGIRYQLGFFFSGRWNEIRWQICADSGQLCSDNIVREAERSADKWSCIAQCCWFLNIIKNRNEKNLTIFQTGWLKGSRVPIQFIFDRPIILNKTWQFFYLAKKKYNRLATACNAEATNHMLLQKLTLSTIFEADVPRSIDDEYDDSSNKTSVSGNQLHLSLWPSRRYICRLSGRLTWRYGLWG